MSKGANSQKTLIKIGELNKMDSIEDIREKAQNKDIPCEVCEGETVRTAITYNGIKICHNCMDFFHVQAKLNNRTWEKEIDYQTKYLCNGE